MSYKYPKIKLPEGHTIKDQVEKVQEELSEFEVELTTHGNGCKVLGEGFDLEQAVETLIRMLCRENVANVGSWRESIVRKNVDRDYYETETFAQLLNRVADEIASELLPLTTSLLFPVAVFSGDHEPLTEKVDRRIDDAIALVRTRSKRAEMDLVLWLLVHRVLRYQGLSAEEQDQATIGKLCFSAVNEIVAMLAEKNKAYGNSALDPLRVFSDVSHDEQLNVRMDDKLSRIMRGNDGGEDPVKDLIGYLFIKRVFELMKTIPMGKRLEGGYEHS